MSLSMIIVLSVFIEAIWESCKMIWQDGKFSGDMLGTLIVGIALALISGADLPAAVGIELGSPIIGRIITGILISRGSNYLHDVIKKLQV